MAIKKYVLNDDLEPVECDDIVEWARWFTRHNAHVAGTTIGSARVSTIFKGMDLTSSAEPPLVFETMVFGSVHNGRLAFASTYAGAIAVHQRLVGEVLASDGVTPRRRAEDYSR
jgi:hypothetical protein